MVLLIVMFVLMMATALAGVALRMSRNALHEAGNYRTAVQSRYLTEAVLQQCVALMDGAELPQDPPGSLQLYARYGTRGVDAIHTTYHISRANMTNGLDVAESPVYEAPGATNSLVGTLGTANAYTPDHARDSNRDDFVCYAYDCRTYAAGTPGGDATLEGGSNQADVWRSRMCQIVARTRMEAEDATTRSWANLAGQVGTYNQVLQGVSRRAVGTFIMQTKN